MSIDNAAGEADGLGLFDDGDWFEYGATTMEPWSTPVPFDGCPPVLPRRPELLDGAAAALLWRDLRSWALWLTKTFPAADRLFPPCWPQHPALTEELLALWWHWQSAWMQATDPAAPAGFLRELDWSMQRVERWAKAPCDNDRHTPQQRTTFPPSAEDPDLHHWWSNPQFII
jgi:hypothetical protein